MMPGISSMQSDPSMMMFAENFRNQCIAMSQYYASHPEARVESPEPMSPPLPTLSGTGSSNAASKRILISAFPSTKRENSHHERPMMETNTNSAPIMQNDDVLDLLDQLAAEEPVSAAAPVSNEQFMQSPPREHTAEPVERKQSTLAAFWRSITTCGKNNTHP